MREYVDRVGRESAEERGAEDREKTGVPLGRSVINPVNGEQIPMFVADYVLMEYGTGAIMAVPAPRQPRLRIRQGARVAGEAGDRGRPTRPRRRDPWPALFRHGPMDELRAVSTVTAIARPTRRSSAVARLRGPRALLGQLPPARLAGLAPALLGRPDPGRLLRRLRHRPRPRRPAPGRAARRSRTTRRRARARWPPPRTGSPPSARAAAARPVARPTRWTPSSTPPGTSSATSTRTTRGGLGPRCGRPLAPGRPVHRRGRARDPAPDVRAFPDQDARRHRPPRRAGAVRQPLRAGDDHPRRGEDVEVEGQHRQPRRVRRALRRRHRPHLHLLHGAARARRRLVRRGGRGGQPLPRPAMAALRGGRREGGGGRRVGRERRRPRAARQGALGDRQGRARTSSAASSSTPRSPR